MIGRAYLYPELLTDGAEENVFIHMIIKLFTQDVKAPIIGGIFLCGILAAIMSTVRLQYKDMSTVGPNAEPKPAQALETSPIMELLGFNAMI